MQRCPGLFATCLCRTAGWEGPSECYLRPNPEQATPCLTRSWLQRTCVSTPNNNKHLLATLTPSILHSSLHFERRVLRMALEQLKRVAEGSDGFQSAMAPPVAYLPVQSVNTNRAYRSLSGSSHDPLLRWLSVLSLCLAHPTSE